ncbi:TPA: hypothetical protein ACH3X1_013293 [Trebouxia sp. C0004]
MKDDNCTKARSSAHVQDCNNGQTAQAIPGAPFKPNNCHQPTGIQPQVKERIAKASRGTTQQAGREDSSTYNQPLYPSSQPPAVGDLMTRTDCNAIRARSALLDIPSAELLNSLLDYADVVCEGSQKTGTLAPSSCSRPCNSDKVLHAQPANKPFAEVSHACVAKVLLDRYAIVDTAKLAEPLLQALQTLPEGLQSEDVSSAKPSGQSCEDIINHGDVVQDEVTEAGHSFVPCHECFLLPEACSAAWYGYLNRMYDTSTSGDNSQDEDSSTLCFDNNAPGKIEDANVSLTKVSSRNDYFYQHRCTMHKQFMIMTDTDDISRPDDSNANATTLCVVWTDEEVCLEEHDIPCVATVGVCGFVLENLHS